MHILVLVLIWKCVDLLVSIVAPFFISYLGFFSYAADMLQYDVPQFLRALTNFDGIFYIRIALNGYSLTEQAFFPVYPVLIRIVNGIVQQPIVTGVLISHAAFLVGVYMFYQYVSLMVSPEKRRWVLLFLLAYPTSYYFGVMYTESLFFMWIMGALLFVKKKRYLDAAMFGYLAALTRFIGVFLVVPLGILLFETYRKDRKQGVKKWIFKFYVTHMNNNAVEQKAQNNDADSSYETDQTGVENARIGVIGLGKIGLPLAQRLRDIGFDAVHLQICNESSEKNAKHLAGKNIEEAFVAQDNDTVVRSSDYIFLALKQGHMIEELRRWKALGLVRKDHKIISFAAGVRVGTIKKELGNVSQAVVRAMPNVGVSFGMGTIGWHASDEVTVGEHRFIHHLLSSLASTVMYVGDETAIDTITAHYGGGPAYYAELAEKKILDAQNRGLSMEAIHASERENIMVLAQLLKDGHSFADIKKMICSEKGTTEAAITSLKDNNFGLVVQHAMNSAIHRAGVIADDFDHYKS